MDTTTAEAATGDAVRPDFEQRPEWWRSAVLYQVYPRSYADASGDGVGDLTGILDRLDHLQWLGIDGIWLSPIHPSPNADWGYDVADYKDVDADLGDIGDADSLIAAAAERGIRVILDLVPNHTSSAHPWFINALTGRDATHRDFYVWSDPAPDGGPPNNWLSVFGGPAWTLDEASGQYYLHNFLPEQPDLNWWNPKVREAFDRILRYWFDRGVAGFRIDVCHGIVKDAELRDNPLKHAEDLPVGVLDDEHTPGSWMQERRYNMNRPEVHDVLRQWREIANEYDGRVLVGETWAPDLAALARYYGDDDELHMAFNFHFTMAHPEPLVLAQHVRGTLATLPVDAWPTWTLSNHDISRVASRWFGGDQQRTRAAMVLLLTLPGTPVLYYGDEIGMTDVEVAEEQIKDPVGRRHIPGKHGRDPVRTPMQWSAAPGAGFTGPSTEPWLPFGNSAGCNVLAQQGDPDSLLNLVRDAIALRGAREDLVWGGYAELHVDEHAWAFRRGDGTVVALNLSPDEDVTLPGIGGSVLLATDRSREGEQVVDELVLPAASAVVISVGD